METKNETMETKNNETSDTKNNETSDTPQPRCAVQIAVQMLKYVPDNEYDLKNELDRFIRNGLYSPYELTSSSHHWIHLQQIAVSNIKMIDTQWKADIFQIFTGKTINWRKT